MRKIAPTLALLFFMLPSISFAAGLTSQQSTSLIAVVQSSPGVPASAFVNLITSFSNITVNQATSLIAVVQAAPSVPASAFVNLLTSFTVDAVAVQSITPVVTPVATMQTQTSIIQISSVNITPTITSAKIEWQTDKPTESKVFLSGDVLSSKVYNSESGLSTRHSISVSGLKGETNYSYEIEAIAGGNSYKKTGSFNTETPPPTPQFIAPTPAITLVEKGILAEKHNIFSAYVMTDIPTTMIFTATNARCETLALATIHTCQISVPVNYHTFSIMITSEKNVTSRFDGRFDQLGSQAQESIETSVIQVQA